VSYVRRTDTIEIAFIIWSCCLAGKEVVDEASMRCCHKSGQKLCFHDAVVLEAVLE
jgi:hypothetical protein